VLSSITRLRAAGQGEALLLLAGICLLSACVDEPRPRSYLEFMDDSIAREGTLARCNQDRTATADDPECINARRATTTIAAIQEAAQAEQREAESEFKREALRDRYAAQQAAARSAEELAQTAAEASYEARWTTHAGAEPQEAASNEPPLGSTQWAAAPEIGSGVSYGGPTGGAPSVTPRLEYIQIPRSAQPELEYIELPATVYPELEQIGLPDIAQRREAVAAAPELEEIAVPESIRGLR